MKRLLFVITIFLVALVSYSQEENKSNWQTGGTISVNVSQSTFRNWVAGGENSYGGTAFFNMFAKYIKGGANWDNTLDLGLGMMKQGERPIFKTDDKIDFASKLGYKASESWNYSVLLGFKTQFYEGKKSIDDTTKISNFMAPAYLSFSLGMDYKPSEKFSLFLSPTSLRLTFVNDIILSNQGAFGVDPGKKLRMEFGGYARVLYKDELWKNTTYSSKLELFSNYIEKAQNIDVNWESTINFKFNDYLSANFYLTLLYDDDSKILITHEDGTTNNVSKLQIREIFGIGLTYKF
jgi:hypothetical protein